MTVKTRQSFSTTSGEHDILAKASLTGTDLGSGITAGSASLLLVMEGAVAAASAKSVRLGVTLTEGSGTLGLRGEEDWYVSHLKITFYNMTVMCA